MKLCPNSKKPFGLPSLSQPATIHRMGFIRSLSFLSLGRLPPHLDHPPRLKRKLGPRMGHGINRLAWGLAPLLAASWSSSREQQVRARVIRKSCVVDTLDPFDGICNHLQGKKCLLNKIQNPRRHVSHDSASLSSASLAPSAWPSSSPHKLTIAMPPPEWCRATFQQNIHKLGSTIFKIPALLHSDTVTGTARQCQPSTLRLGIPGKRGQ